MTNTVIKVENLTKQYRIMHETKDPYKKFSDVLVGFAKNIIRPWKFFQTKEVEMFKALNDVNFEIKKGEKIAIIGRNGAGKSTLLKVLSRITEPTDGSVKIKGRVASLLEVGTGFHPELTGRENIFLNGAILGMSKKEIAAKFDDIVEFSGCEKFLDTPVKRYSSGMRVRLGFAVAAHLESEILIVDEVLAVGDAEFQKKCLGKMDEISKGEGRTIIFVSHNMSAVQNLCDKGLVIDKGEVKFSGEIEDAVSIYERQSFLNSFNITKESEVINFRGVDSSLDNGNLKASFKFNSSEDLKNCHFNMYLVNSKGIRVSGVNTVRSSDIYTIEKGDNELEWNISDVHINTGQYYFEFWISKTSMERVLIVDNIKGPEVLAVNKYTNLGAVNDYTSSFKLKGVE